MSRPTPPLRSCPERETTRRLAEATAVDPALLFVRLSASSEAEDAEAAREAGRGSQRLAPDGASAEAEALAADVLAAIRIRAAEREGRGGGRARAGRLHLRPWLRAAAVFLLASGLAAVLLLRRPEAPVSTPPSPPDARSLAAGRPIVERLDSPGARVYQFASGAPSEPTVVFIANPGADL